MTFTLRNYRDQDLAGVADLIAYADHVDRAGLGKTIHSLTAKLAIDTLDPVRNAFVAEEEGRLLGFVRLRLALLRGEPYDRVFTMGVVHPAARRRGIGTALMRRVEQRARELQEARPLYLYLSAREAVSGMEELAQALGYEAERYFYWLERDHLYDLPVPVFPVSIRLRSYVVGQDEQAFVDAQNEAFAEHWGFVQSTVAGERERQAIPGFCPQDTLLAVDSDDAIVGFALVYMPRPVGHLPEGSTPVVEVLGVRPAYRRQGVGRAMLLAAARYIRAQGFSAVGLSVDVANPHQALRLYESAGFVRKGCNTAYRKLV